MFRDTAKTVIQAEVGALTALAEGLGDALLIVAQKGFGVVGVSDADWRPEGIVTDGDLRRNMAGLA